VVDGHIDPHGVPRLLLFEHGFIQRAPHCLRLADARKSHRQEHPLIDDEVFAGATRQRALERRHCAVDSDLGKVAEHADVDAKHRHRRAVQHAHGAQHGAVAAEHHHEVGVARLAVARSIAHTMCLGVGFAHPQVMAASRQLRAQFGEQRRHLAASVVGHHHHVCHALQAIEAARRAWRISRARGRRVPPSRQTLRRARPCAHQATR